MGIAAFVSWKRRGIFGFPPSSWSLSVCGPVISMAALVEVLQCGRELLIGAMLVDLT